MFEIKVTIEAPEIVGALTKLSEVMAVKAAAPVIADAAPAPVQAAPEPVPAPAPVQTTPVQTAPAPVAEAAPAPAPVTPEPPKPEPKIDMDAIARAGAGLIEKGKMPEIMNLLKKYGVQAVTQLKAEQYADFATDLRGLGAEL